MTEQTAGIGHNRPTVTIPKEDEMLADLQARYPEIDKEIGEFEKALTTYPPELTLDQPDVAESLQDLLGQMRKIRRVWDAHEKGEKGPLNKLVKVVTNFFTKSDDRVKGMLEIWEPRLQAFMDKKKAEASRKMEEEAEAQRQSAEAARLAREKAEKESAEAAARAEQERQREQEAREAAAKARRERAEAEARAEAAKAEEKRLAAERAAKDKAEKEANADAIRDVRGHMREAEKLHALAEAGEASDDEGGQLEGLVRPGGVIGAIAARVSGSALLDDEQKAAMETLRTRLGEMRDAINARSNKREQARREKERKAAEEAEAKIAAERKAAREAEDKLLAEAKERTRLENEAAEKAKEEKRKAEQEARDARSGAREADSAAKTHGKQAARHGDDADRAENRADRVENRLEKATDASLSQTRGDLGTVGGITRRWQYRIMDEAALRAISGPLGEYLTTTALEGACFHYMRARQGSWTGKERVEDAALPGVVFSYEQEIRIA